MKKNKDNHVSAFVDMLQREMDELVKEISNYTTDVEITCKLTIPNVPTYIAYGRETQENINNLKKQMKDAAALLPGGKSSVRVKMKDKYIGPEDPMKNRKFDTRGLEKEFESALKGDK